MKDLAVSIPQYGEEPTKRTNQSDSTLTESESQFYLGTEARSHAKKQGCYQRLLVWLNVDDLPGFEFDEMDHNSKDSHRLMKQVTQMKGVTRWICIGMTVLSVIYFVDRLRIYYLLIEYGQANQVLNQTTFKFENMQLLHLITIAHSLTCVVISLLIFCSVRTHAVIDRRQYYFSILIGGFLNILFWASLGFVIYRSTVQ